MRAGQQAAVIGLGLIGGSVARDLANLGVGVKAYDANRRALDAARRDGIVHESLDENLAGIGECDVVIIAVPVDAAVAVLRQVASRAGECASITDVGSTKAAITRSALEIGVGDRFVGAHPMAGSHLSGWEASRAGLFQHACVYLCPTDETSESALSAVDGLWTAVGARPVTIAADEHDRRLAWTSHLPHLASAGLALALAHGGFTREDLGPGGRDVTRLAGSSPDVWTAIACENAAAIDDALARLEREIAAMRHALSRADPFALRACFGDARNWFESGRIHEHS